MSENDSVEIEVDKHSIIALIQKLRNDVLVKPGKFLFVPIPGVVSIFTYLHNAVERIVKDRLSNAANKEILKNCLAILSEDIALRKLWNELLEGEDNENIIAGSVLLLQRIVTIFLKSIATQGKQT